MDEPHAQLLRDYLGEVRRTTRRRALRIALVDALLLAGAWAMATVAWVGFSARGDLGQTVGGALGLLMIGGLTLAHVRGREALLGWLSLARAISRGGGTTSPQTDEPTRALELDATLRYEILGATELWLAEHSDSRPGSGSPDPGSPELRAAYIERIGRATLGLDPSRALPRPRRWPRVAAALTVTALGLGLALSPLGERGLAQLIAGTDGRPAPPPQPVWTALVLVLDYPEHTRRPDRRVPNPSGAIRVPAGTVVRVELDAAARADAVRLVLTHDRSELAAAPEPEVIALGPVEPESEPASDPASAPAPESPDEASWAGEFTVRGASSWVVALLDASEAQAGVEPSRATRHSAPMRIELEPDAPPEVELLPLPASQREANETDRVELRFSARDDFGVVSAELVYEIASQDGELERRRLPAGKAPADGARTWRHRHTWDLSAIPIEDRSAVTYWIEVRDNDPGLGLVPLVDGPGKVAASARQQLLVHDQEAEHAANIRDLQDIRDAAVDLLAARLTTQAFASPAGLDEVQVTLALREARRLHLAAAELLTLIAGVVDALAVDTMVPERDVETLAGIHERLLALHRVEAELHESLPVGAEQAEPSRQAPLLRKLGPHNSKEVAALEDEIIRLDDLVDGQIIDHIEALVARLQASQQKLVEKLEQLAAGDESVRPEIEQLEQRIREDTRRVQEARAQLRKEVGDEWMNLDAFKAMEARMRSQELLERLAAGDVQGALDQAREQLDAIRNLREQVQRSGSDDQAVALSEEDRQRMKMLRELSRLQDEQTGLRSETRRLEEDWRDAVDGQRAAEATQESTAKQAQDLREALDEVDDSNLSREGRRGWEDAREALDKLGSLAESEGPPGPSQLELFDAAREAADALQRASGGAKPDEAEAKALRELAKQAARLERSLREPLPAPDEVLEREQIQRLEQLAERQRALRERAAKLLEDPAAAILPEPGRQAMRRADQSMREAGDGLEDAALDGALDGEQQAWNGIQQAIDSLRQSSPPPPPGGGGESSTEAERDRSLRDQVVEAMREGDRDGFDADTTRYYEELLR